MLEKFNIATPIGDLTLIHHNGTVYLCEFSDKEDRIQPFIATHEVMDATVDLGLAVAFKEYFSGDLEALDTIPVCLSGTDFQQQVWIALRSIKAGQIKSYGGLARLLGSHARAIGRANSQNSIALIIPCHRVIGSEGSLTGYAGGLERKKWLLTHEGASLPPVQLSLI